MTDLAAAPAAILQPTRLVFVGGLHRSGTSPLARALAAHADISGMHGTGVPEDEGQHLQATYPRALDHGGAGAFALDPRAHLVESDVPAGAAAALATSWTPWWDLDRPLLLEKSPPNLIRMRYLQRVFPGARFVLLLRHPLVVSLAQKKGRRPSLHHLLRHWATAHELAAVDAPHVEHLLVLTYEELVAEPDAVLASVHRWLGVTPTPLSADVRLSSRDMGYHERWHALATSARWRGYVAWLRRRHGDRLASFGYGFDTWTPDAQELCRAFPTAARP